MLDMLSRSSDETELVGKILGDVLQVGDTVLLHGAMGSGKTTLARGIAMGAGCTVSARSPTFIIVAEYPGTPTIFHCDLYRLSSAEEVHDLGLEENLARGALVVEWPENACGALPDDALHIELTQDETDSNSRKITLRAVGTSAIAVMDQIGAGWEHESQSVDADRQLEKGTRGRVMDRVVER